MKRINLHLKYYQMFWVFVISAFLQTGYSSDVLKPDSVSVSEELEFSNFSDNLESLMNLWYVQSSIGNDTSLLVGDYENDTLPSQYPDSVYIERLSRIPAVIPLSYNRLVRNYINVYTNKKKDKLEVMLGLSDYYFPMIEEILDYYDLPIELKYMAIIESALNPRAVSRVGATGMWQFMYRTGRAYGLTINSFVDERRDPVKATIAAAHYLKDMYNIYHDWTLVIASYNCGAGNVNKAIRRSGGKRNYWDIYYYLPRETRGYVPAFIAAAYSMNYYSKHNLSPVPINMTLTTDTLVITDDLHLKQVAEVLNVPLKELRDLNPQYRKDIIPGKSKPYVLTVPLQYAGPFIDYQDSIFAYKDSIFFDPKMIIQNPGSRSTYVAQAPTGKAKLYYTVKSGDNLGFISEWYHVRVSDLRYWNGVRRNMIRVGQKLKIYVSPSKVERYKKINGMSFAQKQRSVGNKVTASASKPKAPNTSSGGNGYVYYKVRNGDSIWEIAKKYPGVSDADILRLNNMSKRSKIHPGQKIKIKPL